MRKIYGSLLVVVILYTGNSVNSFFRNRKRVSLQKLAHVTNGDEQRFADRRGNYAKALRIQDNGFVDPIAYDQMVYAFKTRRPEDFNNIPMGTFPTQRKLADPQAAFASGAGCPDSSSHTMPPPPSLTSAETAGEMVELYWHALLRDVPFNHYATNPLALAALADLNQLSDFKGPKINGKVTPQTLFRGNLPGDLIGPMVSQFLYLPIPYGPKSNFNGGVHGVPGIDYQAQVVPTSSKENDFCITHDQWLMDQRGYEPRDKITYTVSRMFIRNERDLGDYVHQDYAQQAYTNAALILLKFGTNARDKNNPFMNNPTQSSFPTYDDPELMCMIAEAVEAALCVSWYQKWIVHKRLRPERYAFLVDQEITAGKHYGLHEDVLHSTAAHAIADQYGTYLLPQAYPEGAPTHPSYPAGHAVIAGAAVTVLKAFFNEDFIIPHPMQPNMSNTQLESYRGLPLTVGGELNKLASNISLGRDYAGVHFRSDGIDGLNLGEQVALGILDKKASTRNIPFKGYSLTKFDGTQIVVGEKK